MIINNDCLDEMSKMEASSVSCIVTDPPYGLHFMGKDWDQYSKGKKVIGRKVPGAQSNSEAHDAARYDETRNDEFQSFIYEFGIEALRIVKPGGHILMFGAPRRYHRQTCGLEDAGWEIRDCLMWVFGSGFPKSHNHFGIPGFGTALKPAYEPIIMAMKPCDGTFKENAETWGQAGINIDACRIGSDDTRSKCSMTALGQNSGWNSHENKEVIGGSPKGRWPANILFDEEAAKVLDEQSGELSKAGNVRESNITKGESVFGIGELGKRNPKIGGDNGGGASRFFYCAKTSSRERNEGLDSFPVVQVTDGRRSGLSNGMPEKSMAPQKNHHPTVKPLKLMRYLITLVMPPKDGVLLDPFAGSGSTIVAAHQLGLKAIGIEKSADYCEIARKRIENASVIKKEENPQMDFLDGTNQ